MIVYENVGRRTISIYRIYLMT